MEPITLPDNFVNYNNKRFVVLGKQNMIYTAGKNLTEAVRYRLDGITDGPVNGFWGTLGRADGLPPTWEGELYCSGDGNPESTGDLSTIVDDIREWQPENPLIKSQRIIERFIAFDEVDFGSSAASRQLRLTLMLGPQEGVILFYHHGEPGSKSQTGDVEFILPIEGNAASDKPGRKTFYFEVPEFSAAHNDIDEDSALKSRFVVKAMVFAYDGRPPLEALRSFEGYGFKRYNKNAEGGFEEILPAQIDFSKKTLLLVHGTFASIRGSFRGLTERKVGEVTWFQYLLDTGHYEQIIGFDHSTVIDSTFTNVSEFKNRLEAAQPGWRFTHPVDIIGTSRGGVVVKTMCNDAELNGTEGRMQARKVALVSCANGAALLDTETGVPGIRLLLSLLKRVPSTTTKVIISVIQLAFEVFLRQEGTLSQTRGTVLLGRVLNAPVSNPATRFYTICGNWEPPQIRKKILDLLLDTMLHNDNDGVNYTERMTILQAGTAAYGYPPAYFLQPERVANAFHTGFFTTPGETRPENYLREYLTDDSDAWKGTAENLPA